MFLFPINNPRRIQFLILPPSTSNFFIMFPTITPDHLSHLTRFTRPIMTWTITYMIHIPTCQFARAVGTTYWRKGSLFRTRHVAFYCQRVIVGGAWDDQSDLTWRAWTWMTGKRAGVGACMSCSRTYVEAGMGRYGVCTRIRHSTTEASIISYHPYRSASWDLPVRWNPVRSSLLTPWTPPNSFFLTINHPQSRLILLIIPPTPIFNTIVMKRGITSLIMTRNDFRINHINPHGEW